MIHKTMLNAKFVKTTHGQAKKHIILSNDETSSKLTQLAVGIVTKNDDIPIHSHSSMNEYYYFLEGNCSFVVDNNIVECNPSDFIEIPSKSFHTIKTNSTVKFLYWGIAL